MENINHQILGQIELQRQLTELRDSVQSAMQEEWEKRMKVNPEPSEEELRMAVFTEQLEPQVRDAVLEMNRKGYATKSSGFYGERGEFQAIDGDFIIDEETRQKLNAIGVQVLRGTDLGVPLNKLITQIRFYPENADIRQIKERWDTIATILPPRKGPPAICDRAEEFRTTYAPDHQSLEHERQNYYQHLKKKAGVV